MRLNSELGQMNSKSGNRIVTMLLIALSLDVLLQGMLATCPALFLPSDVVPSIKYNYSTAPFAEYLAQVNKTISDALERSQYAAYSIAIVHRDQVVYSTGLVNTPFRIASITKTFTAMGALVLRERGILSLDDPVKKFLPRFSVLNPYGKHDITLRELMGHAAGLPRSLCSNEIDCPGSHSDAEALESIATMELVCSPWSNQPEYSNLGFAILGHAWEKATPPQQSWGEFVRDEILAPLGMCSSGVDLEHVKLAPGDFNSRPANTSIRWEGPAREMYSTAMDLAKYLQFLINPNASLLSRPSVQEWIHVNTLFPSNNGDGFALPWELLAATTSSNATSILITKAGGLGTYQSFIGFHPDTQLGIAMLASIKPNTTTSSPSTLATSILTSFIPIVEAANFDIISSLYAGIYICGHSIPIVSPNVANTTIEVVQGQIEVTGSPSTGLQTSVNISLIVNGIESLSSFAAILLLKNGIKNTFWVSPTGRVCMHSISVNPDLLKPNAPGSVYTYELQFAPKSKLLQWPSLGAVCHKSPPIHHE